MKTAYNYNIDNNAGNKFKTFLDLQLQNIPLQVTGGWGQYNIIKEIFRHRDHNKKFTILKQDSSLVKFK